MILADEFEELERKQDSFAQENKFSRTKSVAPAKAMCRRCKDTGDHEPRKNDQWTLQRQGHRLQSTNAPNNGQQHSKTIGDRQHTVQWPAGTTTEPTEAANKHFVEATKHNTNAS